MHSNASQQQERRRHDRVELSLPGRYMLRDRHEYPCATIDVSPMGVAIRGIERGSIGERIVGAVPAICEVRLMLPNKHHFLVDLAPFGLVNDNEVYYAADRPYGLIEGTIVADDAPDAGLAWE